jgi:2-haloacid dehalogenase
VLLDWNPEYLYRQLIDDDEERRWFLTEVCSPEWNAAQDAGQDLGGCDIRARRKIP